MQVSLFKKKGPAQPISTKERLRLNDLKVEARTDRKMFIENVKKWGVLAVIVVLATTNVGTLVLSQRSVTEDKIIIEAKELESKCSLGSKPIIEEFNGKLRTRCANIGESVTGEVIN